MSQPDNQPPITIEVPATTSNYTQLLHTRHSSRMEDFRRGWVNALALPDNLGDLIYDICLTLSVPALVSSAWNNLPIPLFIRWGMIGVLIISALTIWHLLEIPEVRGMLVFRLVLVVVGCDVRTMTENLHPSQLHDYLQMSQRAKLASWGCLISSVLLLSIAVSLRGQALQYKPWVLTASVASLAVGSSQRKTVKQLATVLGDIEFVSRLNFQFWVREKTKATAPLIVNVPALSGDWQPDNLITDPVEYVNRVQKHVALVGGTGDGKSTQAQYFSTPHWW